ncbi:MAG TPA: ATP-grasp domain-containing protein [Actinomycetes bacterium]|nr:ATP-grasp domain-containing protein [Actinomycetes bacterium]
MSAASARVDSQRYDVLLLDAASRQSLATARSLGRAGLRIVMGECFAECDPRQPVPGFRSRYSSRNLVLPSFASDADAFANAVVDFADRHPTAVVLPASDGAIAALAPVRDDLAALGARLALPSDSALEVAAHKGRTLQVARDLGISHPRTSHIQQLDDLPDLLSGFDFPLVLKPTSSWVRKAVTRLQAVEVMNEAEAVTVADSFLAAGAEVLAQQLVRGRREGVTLFMVDGEARAAFAHLEHRCSPALGGASVVRESIPLPADIYRPSVELVSALGLQGLCEVEYRRDGDGSPLLMEINARLAGPVETALRAGIDFPLMLWRWAVDAPVERVSGYRTGVRMRWLRGDMRWLRDNYRRRGRPDSVTATQAVGTFLAEFVRTRHYDVLDWRDPHPFLAELRITAASALSRSRRSPSSVSDLARKGAARVI